MRYLSAITKIGLVAGVFAVYNSTELDHASARDNSSNFWEECHNEGCYYEESEEMWDAGSYNRESLGEWGAGNLEEDGELARPGAGQISQHCAAVEMLDRFANTNNKRIDTDDYFAHTYICLN